MGTSNGLCHSGPESLWGNQEEVCLQRSSGGGGGLGQCFGLQVERKWNRPKDVCEPELARLGDELDIEIGMTPGFLACAIRCRSLLESSSYTVVSKAVSGCCLQYCISGSCIANPTPVSTWQIMKGAKGPVQRGSCSLAPGNGCPWECRLSVDIISFSKGMWKSGFLYEILQFWNLGK